MTHPHSFLARKEESKSHTCYVYARGKLFLQATPGLTTHELTLPMYRGLTHCFPNHSSFIPTLLVSCQGCQHCAKFSYAHLTARVAHLTAYTARSSRDITPLFMIELLRDYSRSSG